MADMVLFAFQACFLFLLVYAAISDYRRLKIPNWVSLALCGLFFVYAASSLSWTEAGRHLAVGGGVFAAAVLLYAFGIFGAGDVKLLGAIALWAGPERIVEFAMLTGLLGGVLGLAILVARKVVRAFPALPERSGAAWNIARWGRDGTCPYGIPIAVAAAMTLPAMFAA